MMDVNWIAVIVAAVVYNAIGFAWYSDSLFGKMWRDEVGMSKEKMKMASGNMGRMFAFMAVGSIVMAYVLSVVFSAFEVGTIMSALTVSFWVWLGFIATTLLNGVTYEMKTWRYYSINAGYQLVGLGAMGAALVLLG